MKSLAILSTFLAVSSLIAQEWVVVDPTPQGIAGVHFDPVHQRAVGFTSLPAAAWSFDGSGWRQHVPSGIEEALVGLSAFDVARNQGILVAGSPWSQNGIRTYASSGAGWRPVLNDGPPPSAIAAYDATTSQIITFGGRDQSTGDSVDSMFAWSGSNWVAMNPVTRPGPRHDAGMAFDPIRGRMVLFGGHLVSQASFTALNDTWEWNGTQWSQRSPISSPGARASRLAFDPATQQVVALGGFDITYNSFSDCWGWNGTQWLSRGALPSLQVTSSYSDANHLYVVEGSDRANVWQANGNSWVPIWVDTKMSASDSGAMAYDPFRREILMAGVDPGADTWAWNGSWQPRSISGPGVRTGSAMAALGSPNNKMVVFGGSMQRWVYLSDTWTWDGLAWTKQFTALQPSPRVGHAMTSYGGQVLLFGGNLGATDSDETWTYDGSNWTLQSPANSPPARRSHGMATDPQRGRAVLFGGYDSSTAYADTWEWDGSNWLQRTSAVQPPGIGSALAYDSTRAVVVLVDADRVWAWDGVDWTPDPMPTMAPGLSGVVAFHGTRGRLLAHQALSTALYGPTPGDVVASPIACGSLPDLRLFGRPVPGRTPLVHLEGAPNTLALMCYGLQPGLTTWVPGCDQQIMIAGVVPGVVDVRGELSVPFAIPTSLAFRGVDVYAQSAVLDGGPVFGGSLTGSLRIRIGD
jgi:hypothetical protein